MVQITKCQISTRCPNIGSGMDTTITTAIIMGIITAITTDGATTKFAITSTRVSIQAVGS